MMLHNGNYFRPGMRCVFEHGDVGIAICREYDSWRHMCSLAPCRREGQHVSPLARFSVFDYTFQTCHSCVSAHRDHQTSSQEKNRELQACLMGCGGGPPRPSALFRGIAWRAWDAGTFRHPGRGMRFWKASRRFLLHEKRRSKPGARQCVRLAKKRKTDRDLELVWALGSRSAFCGPLSTRQKNDIGSCRIGVLFVQRQLWVCLLPISRPETSFGWSSASVHVSHSQVLLTLD